jgi:hypothetical protein
MRGLVLYARSRHLWVVAASLVAVGVAVSLVGAAYVGLDEYGDMALLPAAVLGPVPAAILILVTIDEPSAEIALAGARRLHWWRLGHLTLLSAVPVAAYAPLARHSDMAWGYPTAVRNLFGYLGIGLVAGAIWGARWAWTGPMLYGLGGFLIEAQSRSGSLVYWPARPDRDTAAWMAASSLTLVGLAAISRRRTGGVVDDDDPQ